MALIAKNLRPGDKIVHENEAWIVTESQHRAPGKGNAVAQIRMRSILDGRTTDVRFNSTHTVEAADVETRKMQYLFAEEIGFTFMDLETYEQVIVPADRLADQKFYLLENMELHVQFLDGKPIGIDLPASVELEIVDTEPGVKGDTVNNVLKPAKTHTGLVVQVPLFVDRGERIKVDTRSGAYLSRARG